MLRPEALLSLPRPRRPNWRTTGRRLARANSIDDLWAAARRRQPRGVFDYVDGGAGDERAMAANRRDLDELTLDPHVLVDVSAVDTSCTVLGQPVALPVLCAPTGFTRMMHHGGEPAVARAAARAGTIYTLSALGTTAIEDVPADGPRWFQIYVWKDRGVTREFIARCRDAGYHALVLTADVPVFGRRERDLRNGMTIPPRIDLRMLAEGARHPAWTYRFLTNEPITFANVRRRPEEPGDAVSLADYVNDQLDPGLTWRDAEWMLSEWNGPFLVKGVQRAADAARAVEVGFGGVIVSNHGGRQLDHAPSPARLLPEVVDAVGGRADVILDGGVRRGTDVVKALALGATACMAGRAYLYGLGAGGEAGVDRAFELLRDELRRDLALVGCPRAADLDRTFVRSWR
ncbi:MAG: alpha-hydroxy acid oxidase [Acidimicrobiia bacterium]